MDELYYIRSDPDRLEDQNLGIIKVQCSVLLLMIPTNNRLNNLLITNTRLVLVISKLQFTSNSEDEILLLQFTLMPN